MKIDTVRVSENICFYDNDKDAYMQNLVKWNLHGFFEICVYHA